MTGIVKRAEDTIWKTIDGEVVLLKPSSGDYFGLNATGASLWEEIDGEKSVEALVNILHDGYDVDRNILEGDICELLERMKSKGLIEII